MKNFPFEHDGKTYWYSRGIVTISYIFAIDKNEDLYVLANLRGSGVPTPNKWNCPCGHLDFDESIAECAAREIYEETGIKVDPEQLRLHHINDTDFEDQQNIGFHYWTFMDNFTTDYKFSKKHMEKDEVKEIKWINVDELDQYDWAFSHDTRIKEIIKEIF